MRSVEGNPVFLSSDSGIINQRSLPVCRSYKAHEKRKRFKFYILHSNNSDEEKKINMQVNDASVYDEMFILRNHCTVMCVNMIRAVFAQVP